MPKKIVFICVENSCRSQIAEGLARHRGGENFTVYSAGSKPGKRVDPDAVEVMREIGIDISLHKPKGFSELPACDFDYVVTVGCNDTCPFLPAIKHIEWHIDDPKGKGIEYFRKTRDEIKYKIEQLINELNT